MGKTSSNGNVGGHASTSTSARLAAAPQSGASAPLSGTFGGNATASSSVFQGAAASVAKHALVSLKDYVGVLDVLVGGAQVFAPVVP